MKRGMEDMLATDGELNLDYINFINFRAIWMV